jgi:hypothetical protein
MVQKYEALKFNSSFKYLYKDFYIIKSLSYNNLNIDIPCLEWIGLRIEDLDRFYLKNQDNYLIPLNKHDIQIANSLIKKFRELKEYDLIEQVKILLIFLLIQYLN